MTLTVENQIFDVTARKFHQIMTVGLLALGYVLGLPAAWGLVAAMGIVMVGGRFWWPLDIFRQFAWHVLEPRGLLLRRDVVEDHETRRIARVMGGVIFLVGAVLLAAGQEWAWAAIGAIAIMIVLDAAFDFCVLCTLSYRWGRLQAQR